MTPLACRFILGQLDEREVRQAEAYHTLEPPFTLEVQGRNAFLALGIERAEKCIIMVFLAEQLLPGTIRFLDSLDYRRRISDHRMGLTATSLWILLHRGKEQIEISVEDAWEPGTGRGPVAVGTVAVEGWVKAVTAFSRQLLGLFQRLNPPVFAVLQTEEVRTQGLESWLIARGRG